MLLWTECRRQIDASHGSFPAYLVQASREAIERLMYDHEHARDVYGHFAGTTGDRARQIFDEIAWRVERRQRYQTTDDDTP